MTVYKKIFIVMIFLFLVPISCAEIGNIPDTKEVALSWSPDGQWILFHSYGVMNDGIFIVKPDGSDLQKIGGGEYASWSPDNTKVIFTMTFFNGSDLSTGNTEIALLDIKTQNITRLTYGGAKKSMAKFSADGTKIVFKSYDNYIYIMNSDGTELKKLVDSAASPKWSPDSKKIAYYTFEDLIEIWIINIDGTNKEKIFIDYKYLIGGKYRWTADSNYLLLNNGSTIITKVNIDNASDIGYIYDPVAPLNPEYSPDGNYITFISNRDGGDYDLFVARSNGSDLHRLVYDTNPKTPFDPGYFGKIDRPTPPPWPTPEPNPVVTSTAEPANISAAEQTSSIPGFSALAVFVILVSLASIKRRK